MWAEKAVHGAESGRVGTQCAKQLLRINDTAQQTRGLQHGYEVNVLFVPLALVTAAGVTPMQALSPKSFAWQACRSRPCH